jgi:hypothetical protein
MSTTTGTARLCSTKIMDEQEQRALTLYATLVARLCHPLADRHAILWHAGLDEAGFARLEAACLARLTASAGGRSPEALFVSTLAAQRGHPPREGDLEEMMRTIPTAATAPEVDPEEAMTTLPSKTEASPLRKA